MLQGNKIILVIGILAIAAAIFSHFEAKSFHKNTKKTEGTVVHVIASSYQISYVTDDGTEKIMKGSAKSHHFREGMKTSVWYRTDNPDRVRLSDGKKAGRALLIAGAFCVLMGVYPLFMKKKGTAEKADAMRR